MINRKTSPTWMLLLLTFMLSAPSFAQGTVGGHFGMVLPIASITNQEVTTLSDNFVAGFPIGLTAWLTSDAAFDLEVVPFIDNTSVANILIHPGMIRTTPSGFAYGIRAAFETAGAFGFTPLLNKGFPMKDGYGAFFIEVVVPVRWMQEAPLFVGDSPITYTTIGFGIHTGIGF